MSAGMSATAKEPKGAEEPIKLLKSESAKSANSAEK
jgi:hypothetical protein